MLFELDDDVGSTGRESLSREVEVGNVEYKLKLVEPTAMRFQGLVTQLKWRLAEGAGEALYEIGVGDDGTLAGLGERDMAASLDTLRRMCVALSAKQARRVIGVRVWCCLTAAVGCRVALPSPDMSLTRGRLPAQPVLPRSCRHTPTHPHIPAPPPPPPHAGWSC